tara:strand:+ start:154 stop:531 length:378 start_codon:yes stop_codon:yes gene_type:complete
MEREFVTYEIALSLKELSFNEPCLKWFIWRDKGDYQCVSSLYDFPIDEDGGIPAPTYSQAFRWFLEKYGLWFRPDYYDELKEYNFQGTIHKLGKFSRLADIGNYNTYEEAELACLIKLIEIVKSK